MSSPDRLELTPEVWRAARSAVGRGAPGLALGTSSRALSAAAERLSHLTPEELARPRTGVLARIISAGFAEAFTLRPFLARLTVVGGLLLALTLVGFGIGAGVGWLAALGGLVAVAAVGAAVLILTVRMSDATRVLRVRIGRLRLRPRLRGSAPAWWAVLGEAVVTEVSDAPADQPEGRAVLELLVDAPGIDHDRFSIVENVAVDKWPEPGARLPVRVTGRRVTVDWSRVMTHEEARIRAED